MAALQPLYTRDNCSFCAPLQWGLTVFWREAITDTPWLADLGRALEPDGVRLLGHHLAEPCVSQFALSSLPSVTPLLLVNRVKGRLQHVVRQSQPKALQRNYALRSFGSATRAAVEGYVAAQLEHHRMADERVQALLERFQIAHPEVDLSQPRTTSHGICWYNLHVVLVHRERWAEVRAEVLERVRQMIERVCRSKGYSLSRAGILADHVHLALGCPLEGAPVDVALAFLNNLAYIHDMKAVFQFGAFVGTFGEYHQGAVVSDEARSREEPRSGDEPPPHPGKRGGGGA
jgi:REP element-mobilizing transposase RayT